MLEFYRFSLGFSLTAQRRGADWVFSNGSVHCCLLSPERTLKEKQRKRKYFWHFCGTNKVSTILHQGLSSASSRFQLSRGRAVTCHVVSTLVAGNTCRNRTSHQLFFLVNSDLCLGSQVILLSLSAWCFSRRGERCKRSPGVFH